ncbi:MAG: tRNA pseudouridine(55) synthase TruB [Bacteroidales bacterium]|nr:tRNA pseudouridine(55) synthase TruB [Bacteroidales bacterium]
MISKQSTSFSDFQEGEVILINKPYTWSSFDIVRKLKYALKHNLGIKKIKVGHAGTLDPLATGLMIVCTGKETKNIESYQAQIKEYITTIKLGATTPTFDLESKVDKEYPYEHITQEMVEETLKKFTGSILQTPPIDSAVKVNGKRAYELARKGKEVKLKAKSLVIDEFEILDFTLPELKLRIVCSKGTYIRALARDIAEDLKSGGHLITLHRSKIGEYNNDSAIEVDDLINLLT